MIFRKTVERLWFSPDGRWIAVASFQEGLHILETEFNRGVRRFKEEHDIRFITDGSRIISCRNRGHFGTWLPGRSGDNWKTCADCTAARDFSADGRGNAMGYDRRRIRYWDPATGKDHSRLRPAGHPRRGDQSNRLPLPAERKWFPRRGIYAILRLGRSHWQGVLRTLGPWTWDGYRRQIDFPAGRSRTARS